MLISEVIQKVKSYHCGYFKRNGEVITIDAKTTRDQILFGNPEVNCTGVVTTLWASIEVIEKAHDLNANLIICHESLFWNHGDHTDWLKAEKNKTFLEKKALLEKYGIVVWRNHDYVHSGIPVENGGFVDGIFYGLAKTLGWENYIDVATSQYIDTADGWDNFTSTGKLNPLAYVIPQTTLKELADFLIKQLHLNGVKVIGDLSQKITKVAIPFHVFNDARYAVNLANKKQTDCFLTMEIVDFTLAEYVKDTNFTNDRIGIISMGHFNIEEPGMRYMADYVFKLLNEDIKVTFVQAGDHYIYVPKAK